MRYSILVLAFVPAFALSGCTIIPPAIEPQPVAVSLVGLGQTTRVGELTLRPESVIEDSRCPMNARCVWAGRVILDTTVWRGDQSERRQLTLGEPAADGLMLDTVEPGRTTEGPVAPDTYRFHFNIQVR